MAKLFVVFAVLAVAVTAGKFFFIKKSSKKENSLKFLKQNFEKKNNF